MKKDKVYRAIISWMVSLSFVASLSLLVAGAIKLLWDWLLRPTFPMLTSVDYWRLAVGVVTVYFAYITIKAIRIVVMALIASIQVASQPKKKGLMRHFEE